MLIVSPNALILTYNAGTTSWQEAYRITTDDMIYTYHKNKLVPVKVLNVDKYMAFNATHTYSEQAISPLIGVNYTVKGVVNIQQKNKKLIVKKVKNAKIKQKVYDGYYIFVKIDIASNDAVIINEFIVSFWGDSNVEKNKEKEKENNI